jgi:hypothetical protein
MNCLDRFSWKSYDINTILPTDWQKQILGLSEKASIKTITPKSVTSREGDHNLKIDIMGVNGHMVREELPWLYELYKNYFRNLAQIGSCEPVYTAENDIYGAVLNIQRGDSMRYECHVDSNPIEGLLYVTDHPKGCGGELVVANNSSASSIDEVNKDCSMVYPVSGNIVFFDARRFPHYVKALVRKDDVRIVVAMNFYTPSCPESSRPIDLTPHLYGK